MTKSTTAVAPSQVPGDATRGLLCTTLACIIIVIFIALRFLAVQDSSITDIVCLSEPTNNQSLEIRNAMEANTTVVKVRNTLDKTFAESGYNDYNDYND